MKEESKYCITHEPQLPVTVTDRVIHIMSLKCSRRLQQDKREPEVQFR